MHLGTYLDTTGTTRRAFAQQIGAHPVTVTRWITGTHRPSWAWVARIRAATDGQVTAADFEMAHAEPEAA